MTPSLSILTPTWNRASYLERVWRALVAQTCGDFEWIVADDGSADDTAQVVAALAARSDFPVIFLQAEAHVGKPRMDNAAIAKARGQLIMWCDSDDVLRPQAVARVLEVWESIDAAERDDFVGVTALAATDSGVILNPVVDGLSIDISWNELATRSNSTSDMLFVARSDALRDCPFPEVDLVIPESAVWCRLGHRKTRLVGEVLKGVEYCTPNAISFSGVMSYNRGRAHALAISHHELSVLHSLAPSRLSSLITFLRYCWHGDIGLREAFALWNHGSRLRFAAALPAAALFVAHDRLRNTVVKSHREHLRNRDAAVTERDLFPPPFATAAKH